jgi:hypothetical protein
MAEWWHPLPPPHFHCSNSSPFPLSFLGKTKTASSVMRLHRSWRDSFVCILLRIWSAFRSTVHWLQAADPGFTVTGHKYAWLGDPDVPRLQEDFQDFAGSHHSGACSGLRRCQQKEQRRAFPPGSRYTRSVLAALRGRGGGAPSPGRGDVEGLKGLLAGDLPEPQVSPPRL